MSSSLWFVCLCALHHVTSMLPGASYVKFIVVCLFVIISHDSIAFNLDWGNRWNYGNIINSWFNIFLLGGLTFMKS